MEGSARRSTRRPRGATAPRDAPDRMQRVALVTSDGFSATGWSMEPQVAAEFTRVDAFTRFLERRLETRNVALLRRAAAEFFCGADKSLQQMATFGFPMILLTPVGVEDEDARREAATLLAQQDPETTSVSTKLFAFIQDRLGTLRMDLLVQFYVEFCVGRDAALTAFASSGAGAISILPEAVAPACAPAGAHIKMEGHKPLQPWATYAEQQKRQLQVQTPKHANAKAAPHIQPKKPASREAETWTHNSDGDEDEGFDSSPYDGVSDVPSKEGSPDNQLRVKLVAKIVEIEEQEPWKKAFPIPSSLPFDEERYPKIAKRLTKFWKFYSRAVWERYFWSPLCMSADEKRWRQRKTRQRGAALAFERIMVMCYRSFGVKFFIRLDRERHPAWWYRGFCVEMVSLMGLDGYKKVVEYMEREKFKRFPECGHPLPLGPGRGRNQQHGRLISSAMWAQGKRIGTDQIKEELLAYKQRKERKKAKMKEEKRAAKKRRRDHKQDEVRRAQKRTVGVGSLDAST